MRIFIAGGTGVVGRRLLPRLTEAGHRVTAVVRSDEKAGSALETGAVPERVDLFDAAAVAAAVADHEAVINLATAIPPTNRMILRGAWKTNHRLRREASANLADGARAGGAERFIQESIAFAYPDRGDGWIDEEETLEPGPMAASVVDAERAAARFGEGGGAAVVLRFGQFYGPDSSHTRDMLTTARKGTLPAPGRVDAYTSMLHLDDAAAAVAAGLDAPAGTYNVVDDSPLTRAELGAVLADLVGRERLRPMPGWIVRLLGSRIEMVTRSQRVSNRLMKGSSGWAPAFADVATGMESVVSAMDMA
jgi:nucleoside-diphosphate-sugar epimerase